MRTENINGMTVHMPDKKYVPSKLTKDEIMDKYPMHFGLHTEVEKEDVHSAMDEYAKQQALLFTIFRENYQREEKTQVKKEQERVGGIFSWIGTPDNIIYDKFIESLNKK